MSSQDSQQNQISPHNQSAKTAAGAAIGALIMVGEYAWDGIKALWKALKEKTAYSKQKEEQNCNQKPVIEDIGNQQTKGNEDSKQEPKTEKIEEKNNKQNKQEPKAQGDNPTVRGLKGTGPSNNQGRPPSALPSNNNSRSI